VWVKVPVIKGNAQQEIKLHWGKVDAVSESNGAAVFNTGKAEGNRITLQLSKPVSARTITYLTGKDWDGKPEKLLIGVNGIGALTFADVAIWEPKI
jgi:hypothetical protein